MIYCHCVPKLKGHCRVCHSSLEKNRMQFSSLVRIFSEQSTGPHVLKVPKSENFDLTDFFYTIKPRWVDEFRAKMKNEKCLFEGSFSKI